MPSPETQINRLYSQMLRPEPDEPTDPLVWDNLILHPRCVGLKHAFRNYCKQRRGGEWLDFPADGHPEEDFMDALRGGIRNVLPEGAIVVPGFKRVHLG